jgi:hypothetical protein
MKVRPADVQEALDRFPGCFLAYGSLLGAVRDGGLIPWDLDLDIAYLAENAPPRPQHCYRIAQINSFTRSYGVNEPNYGVMVGKTKVGVQILSAGPDGYRYHTRLAGQLVRVPSEYVETFHTIDFVDREVLVPDQPERWLDWHYGQWRTPDEAYEKSDVWDRRRAEWLIRR